MQESSLRVTKRFSWRLRSATPGQRFVEDAFARLVAPLPISQPGPALLSHLPRPELLADLPVAVERIVRAIQAGERMVVFADYDVDGITACSMLRLFFREMGFSLDSDIPHRVTEGYGLSVAAVERIAASGAKLIITVDNGIAAHAACARAAELGVDVIVTDHHDLPPTLPPAVAVVNPKRPDCSFPYKKLAGVGVAFYLMAGIRARLRALGFAKASAVTLRSFLDLVALGTIADVVPLDGVNHILCKVGLEVLRENVNAGMRPGLAALLRLARWDANRDITAVDVGFRIGPRLNAAGRLGSARAAEELLFTDDGKRANELAAMLDQENSERQTLERAITEEAIQRVESLGEVPAGIVVGNPEWHPGVVGLVASRLLSRFCRPTIVFGGAQDVLRGSGRSTHTVDLFETLAPLRNEFVAFGGHSFAVGLTLEPHKLEWFQMHFADAVRSRTGGEAVRPLLEIAGETRLEDLNERFLEALAALEPFGQENPQPKWLVRGARIRYLKRLGQSADSGHARVNVEQERKSFWLTAFSMWDELSLLAANPNVAIDFVVEAGMRTWKGVRQPELRVVDFAIAEAENSYVMQPTTSAEPPDEQARF